MTSKNVKRPSPIVSEEVAEFLKFKNIVGKKAVMKKTFLRSLYANLGILSRAAKATGMCLDNHYAWKAEDPEYKKAYLMIEESVIDFAEGALYTQIRAGVPSSTIFFLKTKGKRRGYIEDPQVHIHNENRTEVKVVSVKQLIQMAREQKEQRQKEAIVAQEG